MKHEIENIHCVGTPDAPHRRRDPAARRIASTPMPTWMDAIEGVVVR